MEVGTVQSWRDLAQSVLTRGIDAFAETQSVRYQANDPTPQIQTSAGNSSPAGQPVTGLLQAVTANAPAILLVVAVIVGVVWIVRR